MSFFTKFPNTEYDLYETGNPILMADIFRQIKITDARYDSLTPYQFYELKDQRPDQLSYELYGNVEYHWTFFIINDNLKSGYKAWPMNDQQLSEYVDDQYQGWTITAFRKSTNTANFNSIHNKFEVGDVIEGETSGATATITGRDIYVNQIQFTYNTDTKFNGAEIISDSNGFTIQPSYVIKPYKDSVKYYVDSNGEKISNYDNLIQLNENIVTHKEYEKLQNDARRYIRVLRADFIRDFTVAFRKVLNG